MGDKRYDSRFVKLLGEIFDNNKDVKSIFDLYE